MRLSSEISAEDSSSEPRLQRLESARSFSKSSRPSRTSINASNSFSFSTAPRTKISVIQDKATTVKERQRVSSNGLAKIPPSRTSTGLSPARISITTDGTKKHRNSRTAARDLAGTKSSIDSQISEAKLCTDCNKSPSLSAECNTTRGNLKGRRRSLVRSSGVVKPATGEKKRAGALFEVATDVCME